MSKTLATLEQAARLAGYDLESLNNAIQNGKIEAYQTSEGTYMLLVQTPTRQEIVERKYPGLWGEPITVSAASEKYDVSGTTIRYWVKQGWIDVVDSGYPKQINEGEIAYISEIHHQRRADGQLSGAPLVDNDYLPYQLLHPELSEKRKND